MPPPPGLRPSDAPRPTPSRAEARFHAALGRGLPPGWYAWHSLRVRAGAALEGEGDFVLAIPDRGIIALEIKGGQIAVRDGRWRQNGRELHPPPRAQGHQFLQLLLRRLHESGCTVPAFGVATCFPDTAFEVEPSAGDLQGAVLGEQDLPHLEHALPALADRVLPPPRPAAGPWLDRLQAIWCETWAPRMSLGRRARLDEDRRVPLDEAQLQVLDLLEANNRLLVSGGAGTGKTLLAREAALRFAARGRRVLLLCFTRALCRWLRAHTPAAGLEVHTVRGLAAELLGRAGREPELGYDDRDAWEEVSLRAAADALPLPEPPPDAVVLDEAQDLSANDWLLVEELARHGRLWAFHDPAQAFWPDRRVPDAGFARAALNRPYRCPPGIQALAERCLGRPHDEAAIRAAVADGSLALAAAPTPSAVPERLAREVAKLRSQHLEPGDLAVLSLVGRGHPETALGRAGLDLAPAHADDLERRVVGDTFLRFKGLERPAVVIADLEHAPPTERGIRLHIALTRALLAARIVAPRELLAADLALASFLS